MNFKEYEDIDNPILNENENDFSINEGSFNDSKDINKVDISFLQRKTKCLTKDLTLEETKKMMTLKKIEDESSNSLYNDIYTVLNPIKKNNVLKNNTKFEKVRAIEHSIDSKNKNQDKKNIQFENEEIQTDLDLEE